MGLSAVGELWGEISSPTVVEQPLHQKRLSPMKTDAILKKQTSKFDDVMMYVTLTIVFAILIIL